MHIFFFSLKTHYHKRSSQGSQNFECILKYPLEVCSVAAAYRRQSLLRDVTSDRLQYHFLADQMEKCLTSACLPEQREGSNGVLKGYRDE